MTDFEKCFQNLGTKKRKQLAKQEKKTRRMEEQREAKQRRETQNLGDHEAHETVPIVGDLDALAI